MVGLLHLGRATGLARVIAAWASRVRFDVDVSYQVWRTINGKVRVWRKFLQNCCSRRYRRGGAHLDVRDQQSSARERRLRVRAIVNRRTSTATPRASSQATRGIEFPKNDSRLFQRAPKAVGNFSRRPSSVEHWTSCAELLAHGPTLCFYPLSTIHYLLLTSHPATRSVRTPLSHFCSPGTRRTGRPLHFDYAEEAGTLRSTIR
jgi:hypothetical protein